VVVPRYCEGEDGEGDGPVVVRVPSSLHALAAADVAVTKSGSVTLEAGPPGGAPGGGVPACPPPPLSWHARVFAFRPPYVSLVDLMLGRQAVPSSYRKSPSLRRLRRLPWACSRLLLPGIWPMVSCHRMGSWMEGRKRRKQGALPEGGELETRNTGSRGNSGAGERRM